jgi:hypothetical protein
MWLTPIASSLTTASVQVASPLPAQPHRARTTAKQALRTALTYLPSGRLSPASRPFL